MSLADLIVDDAAARDVTLVLPPAFTIDERRYKNNVRYVNTPVTEAPGRRFMQVSRVIDLGRVLGLRFRVDRAMLVAAKTVETCLLAFLFIPVLASDVGAQVLAG